MDKLLMVEEEEEEALTMISQVLRGGNFHI